ncbi:MAG: hypothetical protein HC824_19520 [Synechococcales cyanobacterium RM1_1_8]|nr:hypothetical protein [Synechococcales cyanobacterium RM1_1_8]
MASQLSADRIHRYLQTPSNLEDTTPGIAMQRAVHQANEQLLQRNNNEQRFLRQRMGTTVVMSWVVEHLTYLGHVGDSRIYRVTPAGYSQLTVDDDVASLSVTQGQTVYRHAVRPSASGALTQALGITEPEHLRPTVQRFFFDDEMLLLLCSDGVSDRDRVAEVWSRILQPVFTEKVNVAVSAKQLLEAANRLNGHDNATVALVHCTVKEQPLPEISPLMALLSAYPLAKSGRQPLPLSAALASADSLANSLADCPANSPGSSPSASHPISQAEAFSQNAPATALRSRRPRLRSPRALPLAIALLAICTLGTLAGLGYQWLNSRPASTRTPGAEANAQRRVPALASALVQ